MNQHSLDHVGIAVSDMDAAIAHYKQLLGFTLDTREILEDRKVEIAFLKLENTKLELICPTASDTTLAKFLEKRGPGLHHLCYRVDDIRAELAALKKKGAQLLDEEPRPGAHGTIIAFVHPDSVLGVLTELCEYEK